MIWVYISEISGKQHKYLLKKFLVGYPVNFQEKVMKYRRWEDSQRSLLGRLVLENGVREVFGLELSEAMCYSEYGKPFLKNNPSSKFNISHSGRFVVCALTRETEIGVDIELMKPINTLEFKSAMTKNEWNKIEKSMDIIDAFYSYWTKKEAVLKANGKGLSIPLKSFEIINERANIGGLAYRIQEISIDKFYKCNLALESTKSEKLRIKIKHHIID